jgi:hypothetical protein
MKSNIVTPKKQSVVLPEIVFPSKFSAFRVTNTLDIQLTRQCPLGNSEHICGHCGYGPAVDERMDFEIIADIFSTITEIGTLFTVGGEPITAYYEIAEMFRQIQLNGTHVSNLNIATSAVGLTETFVKLVNRFVDELNINVKLSISRDEFHDDAITGRGIDLERVLAKVDELKAKYPSLINIQEWESKAQKEIIFHGEARKLNHTQVNIIATSPTKSILKGSYFPMGNSHFEGDCLYFRDLSFTASGDILDSTYPYADEHKHVRGNIAGGLKKFMQDKIIQNGKRVFDTPEPGSQPEPYIEFEI